MTIAELRAELGLSQEEFAKAVGLSSKGHVSQIERDEIGCSVRVALKIEELSSGRIAAETLSRDVALARQAPPQADAAA